jgi:hypothetical protein
MMHVAVVRATVHQQQEYTQFHDELLDSVSS